MTRCSWQMLAHAAELGARVGVYCGNQAVDRRGARPAARRGTDGFPGLCRKPAARERSAWPRAARRSAAGNRCPRHHATGFDRAGLRDRRRGQDARRPRTASGSRSPRITCTSTSPRSHGLVPMRRCCRRCAPPPTLRLRSRPRPPARSISSARIMLRMRSPRRTRPIRGRARAGRRDWTRFAAAALDLAARRIISYPQVAALHCRASRAGVRPRRPQGPHRGRRRCRSRAGRSGRGVARHAGRHPVAGGALAVRGNSAARPAGIDRAPRRGYRRGRQACRQTANGPISAPRVGEPERRSSSCAAFSTSSASCSRPTTACSSRRSGRACRPTRRCTWRAFSCAAT